MSMVGLGILIICKTIEVSIASNMSNPADI